MSFNPFSDHDRYLERQPKDMSIDELRMLLKIKRLNLELGWNELQTKVKFWQRVARTVRESGILEQFREGFSSAIKKEEH